MPFSLRVVFTGVCALVRNSDESKRGRMCIILPDGRGSNVLRLGESLDGQPLKRHRGFLQFKVNQLAAVEPNSLLPNDADAIWYLDRHRVTFQAVPVDRRREPFPLVDTGINRIAKLEMIVPKHSEVDPEILGEYPPKTVLAQILLHEGILSHNPNTIQWVFPPTLAGRVLNPALSHEVILNLPDLEQVDVIATPFDGGEPVRWSFDRSQNGEVTITIANLCDDNPLRWETTGNERSVDNDFRWYYRLLSEEAQKDLQEQMRGFPFPVPLPILDELESGNGQAINCIPAQGANAYFDLDRFLPDGPVLRSSQRFPAQSSRAEEKRSRR